MTQLTVNLNDVWALESPIERVEGITEAFSLLVLGAGTITNPSVVAYRNNALVTSTVFPSGSASASGNIITLPPAKSFTGTAVYVIPVTGTESGNIKVWKFKIKIQKDETE